jgi:hypothetical protein
MKYLVGPQGWPVGGQYLIPPSTVLDFNGKEDHQLSPWERLALNKTPSLDCVALDWDSAVLMHQSYHRDYHYRLRRNLSEYDEDMYQQIISGKLNVR